jgi:hypothetical protein
MVAFLLTVALALLGAPSTTFAGVQDTAFPTFSDGKASQLALLLPTAIKVNNLDTEVICTNLSPAAVDIGLEVFDQTGTRGNTISSGNGALLGVAPGATVTITTGSTRVIHEDKIIVLEAPVIELRNGSARVVATSTAIGCVAFAVDSKHTITAPPSPPPPTITPLAVSAAPAACSPAACDDGNSCTVDGCNGAGKCTHAPVADGTACDDGNACTTNDACSLGTCRGTPVSCGADTPCHQLAVCDPATGQCLHGAPVSTCIPGGGKKATDCAAEWVVENPGNLKGRTRAVQVCRQGDPACDFDADPGQCTFHLRVCLNNNDANIPGCTPGDVTTYQLQGLTSPNTEALLAPVAAFGPSSRTGKNQNVVTFSPPCAAPDQCTDVMPLAVPLRHTVVLKVRASSSSGPLDKDTLKLKCVAKTSRAGT